MKTVLKRALCGITAFVVAAGAMSYFPADTFPGIARGVTAYAENETWRITITADNLADISGDGSLEHPYEITTAEELLAVMEARRTIYAILNDDIVINKDLLKRIDKESGEPSDTSDSIVCWPPIPDGWCINLDGKNHTISGLYINESGKAGLYASLGAGSFKNLTITDSFVKGGDNVGVLIGDSSYSTDSLSADNVKIENTIVRGNNCVGGLFGSLETTTDKTKYTITSCTVGPNVTVTGTGSKIGGIAGKCRGTITNCTVGSKVTGTGTDTDTGNRVGGIAGEFAGKFRGTILYSSSGATVTGKNFVGGVVGYAGGVARIWYCHNDGTVKGETSVGGVLGYGDGGNENPIRYIYNTGDVSGDNDVAGLVGTARISPKYSYNIGNVAYNDGSIAPQLMNYSSYFAPKRYLFYPENTVPYSESGKKGQTTTNESNETVIAFKMDQVASGELAWKLNLKSDKSEENGYANCWVQNLGIDECPTFGDARYVVYPSENGYHNHGSADQIDCDDCRGVAWDPYYHVAKKAGDTSQYEITNYHELLGLAKLVNEKNETITASLMNDIVFNENLLDASGNVQVANPIKWTPSGTEKYYFNGIFNGNGHTISGLYVDGGDYAGLFGKAQGAPEIKGVGVVDSYFKGAKYVGGIAGAYIDVNGIEFDCMAGCFTYNVKLEGTESTTKINKFIGAISGKGNAKLNSNYCLAEKEEPLPGINCSTMTAVDFESGKVAYLMNKYFTDKGNGDVWGQVVANNENVPVDLFPTAYRIIGNGGSNKVINCAGQYHNHLGSATCTICGTVNPQEPTKDNGVYQIGTPSELLWLADRVNGGSGNQDAVLTNDIDMTGVKWTPIGTTKDKAFEWGEFDGQGYVIKNLTVSDSSLEYAGLFGYVSKFSNPATIKDLGVFGEFSGGEYVGGIAGYSENSEITNCFFIGTVSGTNTNGIANEDIIGGTVKNCYFQSDSTDINARTEKQFKSGEVAELLNMLPNGGTQEVWGQTIGADAYPCALTSDNKVIRDYTNLGWHNHTNGTTEDNCPNCVKTPKQENGVYQISTIQELYWFSAYVNNTDSSIKAELANNITVNEDISAQNRIIWTPAGTGSKPFTGTFDGKGHIISGLVKENSTEPVGLFGVIGSGAEVSNVGVVNCIFSSTADAGGIAGINEGTITDSYIYNISPGNGAPIAASGTGKTDNCFVLNNTDKSAEIAYKLNRSSQTWGCKIGNDKLPTAINEENRVYFGKTYHNHDKNTLYCDDCCDFILTKPTEESGWYLISEPGELAWFARLINGGIDDNVHTNAKAKLTEDLDFSAYTGYNWTPIGTEDNPFSGIFDGNSHTISGLKSSGADHAGLFGYADGASISKLIVNGCDFSGNKSAAAMCGSVGTNGVTFNFCGSYDNTLAGTDTAGFAGISAGEVTLDRCYTADSDKFSDGNNRVSVLFYPELTVFKTDKYSVRVKYRLTLENTDKAPAYKDTLHFVFDVQSAPENSKKWNSIVANLAYNNVRQQDFELSLDGVKLEIDAAPVVGNRLNLMLDGGKIGVLYMDKTLKVRIEITYPLNAGKHTISVKYVGSGFDYLAGQSAECAFTISKAIITDPEASVEYGKALKDAELTEGWEWTNSSAVPNSKSRKFKAVMTVDDENYDLSGIKGLNGNKLTREVEVSFKKAVPAVTVTTDPFSALPGTKITVSVSAVNPNNAKFSDVPAAELFYTAGGTVTAITGSSFVIPDGLEEETVITVTAKTEENEFYKAGNGSAEVIVSAHKWSREWKTDKDGHWRECTDCGIAGEKSAHISGGAATETTAEKCTVCGYVITPALKVVEAPVITPDGGSFTGSQTVTITCATDGAAIHYTTDGTEPTASSTKYSGGFTITATTTIKAVAFVGEAKSSVTSAAFTRKAQSGGSGGSGGSVRPTRPDTEPRPSIDGKSMSWAEISVELAKRQDGSTVKIMLNGAYEVPADVIRVIAGKKLHIEFVADSLKSWLTDGAKISAVTAADLSAIPGSADRSALRGISGADLRVSGTKIPADLKLSFRKEFAGQFANVYKPANGKLVFHGCAKLGADGAAIIPGADSAGEYVVMVCEFSDMPGDINNDGVLNALDASAVLKCVVGISQGANHLMGDFNKDGTVNAVDASDILKWIIRS